MKLSNQNNRGRRASDLNSSLQLRQFVVFIAFFLLIFSVSAQNPEDDPEIKRQLTEDTTLMQMEQGAVFIPYIIDPKVEPQVSVYQGSRFILNSEVGKRIILPPGQYKIYIGSVPINFQQSVEVTVEKERVTVVQPIWSALIIRTIDQNNNDIRESYSIMDEETKIQIASGTGADILRGEKDRIWILRPALYRIAKRGESPYSYQNFVTVNTRAGEVSSVQLIFDDKTLAVVGGGEVKSDLNELKSNAKWSFKGSVSGNFALVNTSFLQGGSGSENNFTFGANLNLSLIYDDDNFLFINRLEITEQFQKSENEKLRFIKDLMKFDSSFIYRINRYIGPYISARVRTPFAYRYIVTPGRQNTSIVESDGAKSEIEPETLFVYSKSFSTTIIQEGIGLNADYSYGNILKLNGRVGWGFRQDLNPFAYDISQLENDYEISRLSYFTSLYGPEFYFYFSWFPFSFFEIKEEFDALLPVDNVDNFSFLSRSTVSIWISRFAAIEYEFEVEKSASLKSNRTITSEHSLTVQIYYNFNF
ncbi:DUF3078 domain-containing protein [bacterium]|nr:DUF3078 domain-containing protein [bacterium]